MPLSEGIRPSISPDHLNHDFVEVLKILSRHVEDPEVTPFVEVKDAFQAYLESWIQIVKDFEPLASKIEVFRLAVKLFSPEVDGQTCLDYGQKFSARRFLNGKADLHLEGLRKLFSKLEKQQRRPGIYVPPIALA